MGPAEIRRPRCTSALVAVALLAALVLIAGCGSSSTKGGASGSGSRTEDPSGGTQLDGLVRSKPFEVGGVTVPQVSATGAETPFTFKAPDGKLLFVYFGYTNCPDLCPTTLSDLRKALVLLGPEKAAKVQAAFMTVDPTRDTPELLNQYLASFVKGGVVLRTTDPAVLKQAEDAFGASSSVTKGKDGTPEVTHTAISYLVDSSGRVVVEWPFGVTPKVMAHDLNILLDRLSSGASS